MARVCRRQKSEKRELFARVLENPSLVGEEIERGGGRE